MLISTKEKKKKQLAWLRTQLRLKTSGVISDGWKELNSAVRGGGMEEVGDCALSGGILWVRSGRTARMKEI